MGLTVAVEMLCRHEAGELGFAIDRLVLCNGSHLVELAHITQLQKDLMTDDGAAAFAAAFDAERFALGLRFVWGDPVCTPEVDIRAIAYWLADAGGVGLVGKISRYHLGGLQDAGGRPALLPPPPLARGGGGGGPRPQ